MMKIKLWLLMFIAVVLAVPALAGNLLKNSDFSDLTRARLPRNWTLRGNMLPNAVENGKLTLGGSADKAVMAIQYHLPVKPGVRYTMSWFAAGKAPYKCYAEYSYSEDGKKRLKSFNCVLQQPAEQGSKKSFSFAVPEKATHSYIVFSVRSADTVTLSQLRLEEAGKSTADKQLLKNSDFSILNKQKLPAGWGRRGGAENFRFTRGQAEVRGKRNILYRSILDTAGKNVVFTCRVKGTGRYKIYAEWYWNENGKRKGKATPSAWKQAKNSGEKVSLSFKVPKDNIHSAIIALGVEAESFISFSELTLTEKKIGKEFTISGKKSRIVPLAKFIPGQEYQLKYVVEGSGVAEGNTTFHFFTLQLVDGKGRMIRTFPAEDCLNREQNKSVVFTAPKEKDVSLKIISQTIGTLKFSNLQVNQYVDPAGMDRLVITSPKFRNSFYSSIRETEVAGYVKSKRQVVGGEAVLTTAAGKKHTAALKKDGERWGFSLPGEPGSLEVTLKLQGGKTKVLKQEILRMPPAPVEVITGPGNRLHINGKPFIPIEIARNKVPAGEQRFHGGNSIRRVIGNTPEKCIEILDACQKEHLKVVFSFMNTIPRDGDENKLRLWMHRAENVLTKEVLAHPALLGYFLDDEPFWNGVPVDALQKSYTFLRQLDPYRPIIICSAPRGSMAEQRPYTDCCDVVGLDIYPVPAPSTHSHLEDKTISCVGKYVRRMKELADWNRPMMIVLQACAWGDLRKNKNAVKIYPTYIETRFMTFDAVINGADSFVWWGLWYASSPEFFGELVKVTRELHSLTGVLAADNDVPGKVSDQAVEYRRYYNKDWSCTISANTQNKKVAVRFSDVPGVPAQTQVYEPYEVKIFSTGKLPAPLTPTFPVEPQKLSFQKALAAQRDAVKYTAPEDMKWIWGENEKRIPGSRIWARRDFQVKAGLKKAYLRVTADDFVDEIRVSGQLLDCGEDFYIDYHFLSNIDITEFVKSGTNQLLINARDGAPLPCGLLAEIRLEYNDGTAASIPSNASWQTAPKASGPWTPAAVIKNIGDAPWRMPRILKVITPKAGKK